MVDEQLTSDCPPEKLKEIISLWTIFPAVSQELLQLGAFMRSKYNLRWVDVLRLFVPAQMRGNRVKELSKTPRSWRWTRNRLWAVFAPMPKSSVSLCSIWRSVHRSFAKG